MFQENCYVVSDDTKECVIIDCGAFYEEEKKAITDYIKDNGLQPKHLLCTHGHVDHNFGNKFILDTFGLRPEVSKHDMPLMEWLQQRIFPVEQALTPHIVRTGSLMGYAEMLRTGTTACIDMYIFEQAVFEAARMAGLRCLGGEAVFDFPSACCPTPQAALKATRALAETWKDDPLLRVAVNPHSVYTTSEKTLEACLRLADDLHLPLHIHLAETTDETAMCLEQHRRRPVAHADACGLLRPGTILAHVVDVNEEEIALLADRKVCVAHNASSNMKLASGAAPLPAMLRAGLRIALGTDGAASNNQLNMFTEMGRAALLHKLAGKNPTVTTAQEVLDMATLGGAAAFGEPLGRLEPGAAADFIALDLDSPNLSIDFLAEQLYISRSALFAKIKGLANLTPNEMIQLIRLKKAASLLLENKYHISEVSYMVGFNNPSYFSKCFQKQFGMTPGKFIESHKEKAES